MGLRCSISRTSGSDPFKRRAGSDARRGTADSISLFASLFHRVALCRDSLEERLADVSDRDVIVLGVAGPLGSRRDL